MDELVQTIDHGVLFTLNPDHVYHLHRNREFFEAYRRADFISADSKYVYWSLGWVGRRIKQKCSGSDIVPTFCWHHRRNPLIKVFFLGAAEGVADAARRRVNARCGREIVVGAHSPSMEFVNNEVEIERVIDIINDSHANVLIVGLGAPKQELWIMQNKHRLPEVQIFMGIGAALDYEAGVTKRAPRWMTERGLEWVYRMIKEPRRYWRRYVRDMEFFGLVFLDAIGRYRPPDFDSSSG